MQWLRVREREREMLGWNKVKSGGEKEREFKLIECTSLLDLSGQL